MWQCLVVILYHALHPSRNQGDLTSGKKHVASDQEVWWAEGTWDLWGVFCM